jgi:hypothetical protein
MNQSMSHATLSLICCIAHFFHHDLPPGRFERTHWSSMSSSSSRRVRAVPQDLSRRRFHCHHRLRLVSDTWESVVSWDFHEIFMRSDRFHQIPAACSKMQLSLCISGAQVKRVHSVRSVHSVHSSSFKQKPWRLCCLSKRQENSYLICIFFHSGHGVSFCGINAHTSTWIRIIYTIIHNYTHAGLHLTRISLQREGQNLIWMAWTWSDWSIWR